MKIDRRDRRKGKTADLIMRSEKTRCRILCADQGRKKNILNIANDMGVNIPTPVAVSEYKRSDFYLPLRGQNLLIDDLETVLFIIFGVPVDVATTSSELVKPVGDSYIRNTAYAISELVDRKNQDYDNSFDKSIDKRGEVAYFVRIEDKLNRLENLLMKDTSPKVNESIEDTLSDIIGYSLLMMNYLHNK